MTELACSLAFVSRRLCFGFTCVGTAGEVFEGGAFFASSWSRCVFSWLTILRVAMMGF